MARQIKWRLQFKSLNNTGCLVNIYEDGYTSSSADTTKTGADVPFAVESGVTELTGAAVPFEYEEDDDENLLTPVRFKTGYINVIETEAGELNDLAPQTNTIHYVEVFYGSEVAFSGFMQAQTFENDWGPSPREMSYPIVSPLGLLDEMTFSVINPPKFVSLNFLMAEVFGTLRTLTNNRLKYVVYPDRPVNYVINSLIVSPFNDDYDMSLSGQNTDLFVGVTYKDFVDGLCNCFGCNVREISDTIIFSQFDYMGDYKRCEIVNLINLSGVTTYESGSLLLDLSDYFTLANNNGLESVVMPLEEIELGNDGEYIKNIEFNFNHLAYNGFSSQNNMSAAWLRSNTPELTGSHLLNSNGISQSGKVMYEGACACMMGDIKNQNYSILVNLPNETIISGELFTVKFFECPTSNDINIKIKCSYGETIATMQDEDSASGSHKRLSVTIKMGNYYYVNGSWTTTVPSTGYTLIGQSIHVINKSFTQPLELIFKQAQSTGENPSPLISVDEINISELQYESYHELRTNISKTDKYKLENGYGKGKDSISQLFTDLRLNSNTLFGGSFPAYHHYTNFRYMLLAQNRLKIQFKYNNTEFFDTFYLCLFEFMTTIYNGWRWRIIAVDFDPRNDEYTLTLHRSPAIE